MSWGTNRKSDPTKSKEQILHDLRQVNAVLQQLAFDSGLTDDLKDHHVGRAMKHWTNEHRLPHEEALQFQDNYRVVSVLQKINLLQNCCRQAGITVPLELFIARRPEMGVEFLSKSFGAEVGSLLYSELSMLDQKPPSSTTTVSSGGAAKEKTDKKVENPTSEISDPKLGDSGTTLSLNKKAAYGPMNAGDALAEEVQEMADTFFWSSSRPLTDPNFSTVEFIAFSLGELFFIVMSGLILAYILKAFWVWMTG
jgi:hypothetical protein